MGGGGGEEQHELRRGPLVLDPAPGAATPADPSLLVIFNGEDRALDFRLPAGFWRLALDSSLDLHGQILPDTVLTQSLHLPARSLVVLRHQNPS